MPSCDVNAATRLAEASWRRDTCNWGKSVLELRFYVIELAGKYECISKAIRSFLTRLYEISPLYQSKIL